MTPEQRRFTTEWSLILALDEDGDIVWFYRSPSRIAGVTTLDNGNLFFHTARNSPTEIDWLGRTLRCWGAALGPNPMPAGAIPVQAVTLHHQPDTLTNGNFCHSMPCRDALRLITQARQTQLHRAALNG